MRRVAHSVQRLHTIMSTLHTLLQQYRAHDLHRHVTTPLNRAVYTASGAPGCAACVYGRVVRVLTHTPEFVGVVQCDKPDDSSGEVRVCVERRDPMAVQVVSQYVRGWWGGAMRHGVWCGMVLCGVMRANTSSPVSFVR